MVALEQFLFLCSEQRAQSPRGTAARGFGVWAVLAIAGTVPLRGCTYSGGELVYTHGFGRVQKVEAKFRLTEGPVMIFIDDARQRVDWPYERLGQEQERDLDGAGETTLRQDLQVVLGSSPRRLRTRRMTHLCHLFDASAGWEQRVGDPPPFARSISIPRQDEEPHHPCRVSDGAAR